MQNKWTIMGFAAGVAVVFVALLLVWSIKPHKDTTSAPVSPLKATLPKAAIPENAASTQMANRPTKMASPTAKSGANVPAKNEPTPIQSGLVLERTVAGEAYRPGQPMEVTVAWTYEGKEPITALALVEQLPEGWMFEGIGPDNKPAVVPAPGAPGKLEFAWINVPQFPARFTYRVTAPAKAAGAQQIMGQSLYRRLGGEEHTDTIVTVLPQPTQ